MAYFVGSSQSKGQSTTRPPFFDGSNYNYWKQYISCFIMQDINILQSIKNEVKLPDMEKIKAWIEEDKRTLESMPKPQTSPFMLLDQRSSIEYPHIQWPRRFRTN